VFLVGGGGQRAALPLGYPALVRGFARRCDRLGIRAPDVTPHALRHTHETAMWEGGMHELALQARLGHASRCRPPPTPACPTSGSWPSTSTRCKAADDRPGTGARRAARSRGTGRRRAARHADRENYRSLAPSPRQPGGAQVPAGTAEVVNAGHMPLLLLRAARSASSTRGPTRHSAGCPAPLTYCKAQLEPGDRLVLLTDGMLERNASQARIPDLLSQISDLPPREAVQALTNAVQQAAGGQLLDNATVLVLDWYGGPDQQRATAAGAPRDGCRNPQPTPDNPATVASRELLRVRATRSTSGRLQRSAAWALASVVAVNDAPALQPTLSPSGTGRPGSVASGSGRPARPHGQATDSDPATDRALRPCAPLESVVAP